MQKRRGEEVEWRDVTARQNGASSKMALPLSARK